MNSTTSRGAVAGLLTAVLTSTLAVLAPSSTAYAATASPYYGDSARSVAAHIGCKNFRRTGDGALNHDAGVCWLKGRRVNVITFRNRQQDRDWNAGVKEWFGAGFWWADGQGAVVVAKNGNKPAARLGARRLPGRLTHG
jgi:hypothetical protein